MEYALSMVPMYARLVPRRALLRSRAAGPAVITPLWDPGEAVEARRLERRGRVYLVTGEEEIFLPLDSLAALAEGRLRIRGCRLRFVARGVVLDCGEARLEVSRWRKPHAVAAAPALVALGVSTVFQPLVIRLTGSKTAAMELAEELEAYPPPELGSGDRGVWGIETIYLPNGESRALPFQVHRRNISMSAEWSNVSRTQILRAVAVRSASVARVSAARNMLVVGGGPVVHGRILAAAIGAPGAAHADEIGQDIVERALERILADDLPDLVTVTITGDSIRVYPVRHRTSVTATGWQLNVLSYYPVTVVEVSAIEVYGTRKRVSETLTRLERLYRSLLNLVEEA